MPKWIFTTLLLILGQSIIACYNPIYAAWAIKDLQDSAKRMKTVHTISYNYLIRTIWILQVWWAIAPILLFIYTISDISRLNLHEVLFLLILPSIITFVNATFCILSAYYAKWTNRPLK